MRANPLVCVEVESVVSLYCWRTVIASGIYEELSNSSEHVEQRMLAFNLLSKTSNWWEPGFVKTYHRSVVRPLEAVYFRVRITGSTGHEATQEANTAQE
jgi:nitroimidazol reductase NimA-like FMN-containing flavoprotein (pyridoxamine 5'-phosphate oxidase superfamily)